MSSRDGAAGTARVRMGHLKLRHVLLVRLLAEGSTLAAAAGQLGVTVSAASMAVRDIETLLDARLFEHEGRRLRPTAMALRLLPRCRALLSEAEQISVQLSSADAIERVRVGAIPQALATMVPGWIARLNPADPNPSTRGARRYTFELHEGNSPTLLARLIDGELDVVIGRPLGDLIEKASAARLWFTKLRDEQMVVVAAKTHRAADRRKLTLADLADERWVLTARDSHIRAVVNTSFVQAGLTPPTPQVETPSVIYSIAMVQAADFITVAPPSVIRALDSARKLRMLAVSLDVSPRAIMVFARQSFAAEPARQTMLAQLSAGPNG